MKLPELLELMTAFERSNISRIRYETADETIELEKAIAAAPVQQPQVVSVPTAAPVSSPAPTPVVEGTVVTAPIVGVVYCASAPGKPPYITTGQNVKQGDILCLIEAMKTINEVKAPCDGTVREISFSDGELKEFGAPLVVIGA